MCPQMDFLLKINDFGTSLSKQITKRKGFIKKLMPLIFYTTFITAPIWVVQV